MEILGREYQLSFGLRSMFIFESITGEVFNIKTMFDEYVYFYACLMSVASNPELDFEDFIAYCDEHPELLKEFDEALLAESKRKAMLTDKTKKKSEGKEVSIKEVYNILVVGLGLPPKYVLDEIEFYEVDALLDSYYLKHKDSWEQARLIAYMTAQVNSRNTIKPEDIIKFHWEKDDHDPVVSEADQKNIELEMKQLENILNNKS